MHRGDDVYRKAVEQINTEENAGYQVHSVVLIRVVRAIRIYSPGYTHVHDELQMRKMWRERRSQFEKQFESDVNKRGPYQPDASRP